MNKRFKGSGLTNKQTNLHNMNLDLHLAQILKIKNDVLLNHDWLQYMCGSDWLRMCQQKTVILNNNNI